VDGRPEGLGEVGWRGIDHHRHAQASRRGLHGVEEWADVLDVVAEVGHEGDVAPGRGRHRPALGNNAYVRDAVLVHALRQHAPHALRWFDRDDLAGQQGQREGIAPPAGADVEPGLAGYDQRAQVVQGWLVGPVRIRTEAWRHGRVEVAGRHPLAHALGLLTVGQDPSGPGLEGVGAGGTEGVGHARSVPEPAAAGNEDSPRAPIGQSSRRTSTTASIYPGIRDWLRRTGGLPATVQWPRSPGWLRGRPCGTLSHGGNGRHVSTVVAG